MTNQFLIEALKEVAEKPKQTVKSEDLFSALSFFYNIKLTDVSKGTTVGFINRTYEVGDIAFKVFSFRSFIFFIPLNVSTVFFAVASTILS